MAETDAIETPALELAGLTKRYGRLTAVADLNLSVPRGSVFGLLGQNGAGKSTTLACALGLLRPSAGRATVLGLPARQLHRSLGRVGVVFDAPVLVRGLTVRGQLRYARRLFGHTGGRSADEALALVGMDRLARRRVGRLSLGQEKRLAVAAALMGAPELLVLDEPLSGLDPLGARDLLGLFTELASAGLTILVSSHRLNDIEPVLSHAAVLVGGRLAAVGRLRELLGARGRLRLRVDDRARALQLLEERPGLTGVEAPGDAPEVLYVDAGDADPADLARLLVEGGVALRELAGADRSLAGLFESLAEVPA